MTTTMEEQTTLERLLGTVGETMTRDVVLLAADLPADLLESMTSRIRLEEVFAVASKMLAGETRGRLVVGIG